MRFLTLIFLISFFSCKFDVKSYKKKLVPKKEYLRYVDDIAPNTAIDGSEFKLCNKEDIAKQYFNDSRGLLYEGGKGNIEKSVRAFYSKPKSSFSGLVRVRFLVNCKGTAGRYRTLVSDENYKEVKGDSAVTNQLLNITKSLDKWQTKTIQDYPVDYYQYLIFKIKKGQLLKILP